MATALILGIETSCDETAAAVVRGGAEVLSSVVASQFAAHRPYGGVVPELAAREHLRAIAPVVRQALAEAKVALAELDAIAVTQGPGLAGALLVGISYAKALGFAARKPLIAVNHLEGHIHSVLLEESGGAEAPEFPVLALVVSGGHTHLYLCRRTGGPMWLYRNIGHTRDDAAGEAFDKVAKLLGLGYPGGPILERLAEHGHPRAVHFPVARLKHPERGVGPGEPPSFDFSYSGIKTAVLRYTETHGMKPGIEARRAALAGTASAKGDAALALCDQATLDLVAGFQQAMVQDIVSKTMAAVDVTAARTLIVTGGVAANRALRAAFAEHAARSGVEVRFPSRRMSTDNAAMIAAAAFPKLLAGEFAPPDFSAEAGLALGKA